MKTSYSEIVPYVTKDGSLVKELMHPAKHGNRNLSIAEAVIEQGRATKAHVHRVTEEIYHVVRGTGTMTLGLDRFAISPGDTICILPNTIHSVRNTGQEPLVILCCCAPPYAHGDTELQAKME